MSAHVTGYQPIGNQYFLNRSVSDSILIQFSIQLLPLRSSNLPMMEVKKVLLLGQKDYIEKEWKDLNDFQDVYFMEVQ